MGNVTHAGAIIACRRSSGRGRANRAIGANADHQGTGASGSVRPPPLTVSLVRLVFSICLNRSLLIRDGVLLAFCGHSHVLRYWDPRLLCHAWNLHDFRHQSMGAFHDSRPSAARRAVQLAFPERAFLRDARWSSRGRISAFFLTRNRQIMHI